MTRAQGICLLLLAVLAGCAKYVADTEPRVADNLSLLVHIDRATGCQYHSANGASITPRLRADGSQVCSTSPKDPQ